MLEILNGPDVRSLDNEVAGLRFSEQMNLDAVGGIVFCGLILLLLRFPWDLEPGRLTRHPDIAANGNLGLRSLEAHFLRLLRLGRVHSRKGARADRIHDQSRSISERDPIEWQCAKQVNRSRRRSGWRGYFLGFGPVRSGCEKGCPDQANSSSERRQQSAWRAVRHVARGSSWSGFASLNGREGDGTDRSEERR